MTNITDWFYSQLHQNDTNASIPSCPSCITFPLLSFRHTLTGTNLGTPVCILPPKSVDSLHFLFDGNPPKSAGSLHSFFNGNPLLPSLPLPLLWLPFSCPAFLTRSSLPFLYSAPICTEGGFMWTLGPRPQTPVKLLLHICKVRTTNAVFHAPHEHGDKHVTCSAVTRMWPAVTNSKIHQN